MKYKMIVMDMDDTLLRHDLSISPRTKTAIAQAQAKGIKVVLASGRPSSAMVPYAKELALDQYGSFIVSFNGGMIIDCRTNQVIFQQTLPKETVHELYHISKKHEVFIHTYLDNDIVTPKDNEYTKIEKKLTGLPIVEVKDFCSHVDRHVVKVLMLSEPSYLKKVESKLRPELGHKMNLHISKPYFLEFTDHGIDKAASIGRLLVQLGIPKEEVIAIGDSYNDLSMIEMAGLGVAMGNAPADIKAKADYITDTNMEDGVAKVIEQFVLA